MKYIAPAIISLGAFVLPLLGNRSISWEMAVLIFGYFWVGVALGEEIGKNEK